MFLSPLDPVWVSWQIAKERPGVYLTPGFNPPAYSKVPFVVTIHDLIHLKVPEERGAMRRLYYEVVVKPALSRAFCVLTVSEFSRREILEWSKLAPFRVRVAQNGVSPEFSPEGSARDPGCGPNVVPKNEKLILSRYYYALIIFWKSKLRREVFIPSGGGGQFRHCDLIASVAFHIARCHCCLRLL
ncbi:MAG: glycosyltransferase [Nitrospirae bacterium]|nr:glycosyltransferase [Nitrospirota bacterium]MCL5284884.1 glycosyltransferase [Nitrospirota bacterium]